MDESGLLAQIQEYYQKTKEEFGILCSCDEKKSNWSHFQMMKIFLAISL